MRLPACWIACLLTPASAAELPEELERLKQLGQVRYQYYDPSRERREYPAQADFHFDIKREYNLNYRIASRNGRRVRIVARLSITRAEARVRHTIYLPEGWDPTSPRLRDLIAHEYDHVAISTDPRARSILERLLNRPISVEIAMEAFDQNALRERVEQIHADDMKRSLDVFLKFVQGHNDRLDELTDHGDRPLAERDAFFASLYSPETLRNAGFPAGLIDAEPDEDATPAGATAP